MNNKKALIAGLLLSLMLSGFLMVGGTLVLQAQASTGGVAITDPLQLGNNPVPTLVNKLILAALGLTGVLALLSFIYGGILYMLVAVNADYVKKGKEIMKWSVVGLFIIFSSYAIINFVLGTVLGIK